MQYFLIPNVCILETYYRYTSGMRFLKYLGADITAGVLKSGIFSLLLGHLYVKFIKIQAEFYSEAILL